MSQTIGYEVLGASFLQPSPTYLTVRIKDVNAVLAREGGTAGSVLAQATPQVASALLYDQLRQRISKALVDQGVDAEVRVIDGVPPTESAMPASTDFLTGAAITAGAVGIAYVAVSIIRHLTRSAS